ncbi:hypothetical protein WKK05_32655 [Nostoc sp. UHCC 0302]|uniref:hypothetical protein n=1 Tax=Nostoc sp. UHCC 0302 TaxID=3134896 RepID=UPI00311C991C
MPPAIPLENTFRLNFGMMLAAEGHLIPYCKRGKTAIRKVAIMKCDRHKCEFHCYAGKLWNKRR